MAKSTPLTKAVRAALDAAAAAAKNAKRLARSLPKKDAKSLRSLAGDAKDASKASSRAIERRPGAVIKEAVTATERVEKAAHKAEDKLAAATAAEKKAKGTSKKSKGTSKKSKGTSKKPGSLKPASTPEVEPAPATTGATVAAGDLASLTVAELRARARAAGRSGYSRMTKAQLIELLSD